MGTFLHEGSDYHLMNITKQHDACLGLPLTGEFHSGMRIASASYPDLSGETLYLYGNDPEEGIFLKSGINEDWIDSLKYRAMEIQHLGCGNMLTDVTGDPKVFSSPLKRILV